MSELDEMEARLLDIDLNQFSNTDLIKLFRTADRAKLVLAITKALKGTSEIKGSVATGKSPLTLWVHDSYGDIGKGIVTIGRGERPDRVNIEFARANGIPVIRRESGGWTIYNNGEGYVFGNVFASSNDPKFQTFIMNDAFAQNSAVYLAAIRAVHPRTDAILLPGDASTIIVNPRYDGKKLVHGRCLAMNSAFTPIAPGIRDSIIYLEGAIRYSRESLETATQVYRLKDGEAQLLLELNAGMAEFISDKSKLKDAFIAAYQEAAPFDSYDWKKTGLTKYEIYAVRYHAAKIHSLTDLSPQQFDAELNDPKKKPAKICDLEWYTERYEEYEPHVEH